MTAAVHLGDAPAFLDNPEPTATKLGRVWGHALDWARINAGTPEVATTRPVKPTGLTEDTARAPR